MFQCINGPVFSYFFLHNTHKYLFSTSRFFVQNPRSFFKSWCDRLHVFFLSQRQVLAIQEVQYLVAIHKQSDCQLAFKSTILNESWLKMRACNRRKFSLFSRITFILFHSPWITLSALQCCQYYVFLSSYCNSFPNSDLATKDLCKRDTGCILAR